MDVFRLLNKVQIDSRKISKRDQPQEWWHKKHKNTLRKMRFLREIWGVLGNTKRPFLGASRGCF